VDDFNIQEATLYSSLVEILAYCIRQHSFRSKFFILSEGIAVQVAQLMRSSEKYLKLSQYFVLRIRFYLLTAIAALKYFRACIGLHDESHNRQIIQHRLLDPILQILFDTMPRDNLLNSACLEFFEFIKRENIKMLVQHLVETHRDKLETITYVDTFQNLILRYDQMNEPVTTQELDHSFTSVDSETPARQLGMVNGGKWGQGLKEPDPDQEAYFNGSDDEDDGLPNAEKPINGASPVRPLVNYPDDDGEDEMDILATSAASNSPHTISSSTQTQESPKTPKSNSGSPPERISEKRRREEDEEDELLVTMSSSSSKRRASLNSNASSGSLKSLRRKSPNIPSTKESAGGPKKISLSLPPKSGSEEEIEGK
jgi:protein phosphatase 4 regulatory subunit 3